MDARVRTTAYRLGEAAGAGLYAVSNSATSPPRPGRAGPNPSDQSGRICAGRPRESCPAGAAVVVLHYLADRTIAQSPPRDP